MITTLVGGDVERKGIVAHAKAVFININEEALLLKSAENVQNVRSAIAHLGMYRNTSSATCTAVPEQCPGLVPTLNEMGRVQEDVVFDTDIGVESAKSIEIQPRP